MNDLTIPQKPYPKWEPDFELAPYESLNVVPLDIETLGLDANEDRVIMIGLGDEVFSHPNEAVMLRQFWAAIESNSGVLVFHNGFDFDLPFLMKRSQINRLPISNLIKYDGFLTKTLTGAIINGSPIEYRPIKIKGWQCVDTLHLVACWDKQAAKLSGYGLKNSVIDLGLREDRRLELDHNAISEAWESNQPWIVEEYLRYDLEDTMLLADHLLPSFYYQLQVIPDMTLEQIVVSSTAKRIDNLYKKLLPGVHPTPEEPRDYPGGLVGTPNPGMHRDIAKVDVTSLYPSIMLRYNVHSKKDPEGRLLGVIEWLFNQKQMQTGNRKSAIKVLINSCFAKETEVITSGGVKSIANLLESPCQVVDGNGNWSAVQFKKYGTERLTKITFSRLGKHRVVYATASHRWSVANYDNRVGRSRVKHDRVYRDVTTADLKVGMVIPALAANRPELDQDYKNGVAHGLIYGDGTHHNYPRTINRFSITLHGDKQELAHWVENSTNLRHISSREFAVDRYTNPNLLIVSVESKSSFWLKDTPPDHASDSYKYGFFCGLLAADGHVSPKDARSMISGTLATCRWIEKNVHLFGIDVNVRVDNGRAGDVHLINGRDVTINHDSYNVVFAKPTMHAADFLRSSSLAKYQEHAGKRNYSKGQFWRVVNVELTNRVEDVYCCQENNTSYFALAGGIKTGNCYGYHGTAGYAFNDYDCADRVTSIGRDILVLMIGQLEHRTVISYDTDGVYFVSDDADADHAKIQSALPSGIGLALEMKDVIGSIPKSKNYILLHPDGKIEKKGLFRKRNKFPLERDFPVSIVKAFAANECPQDYLDRTIAQLEAKEIPVEQLRVRRKIAKSEKAIVEAGLGQIGEVVEYYIAEQLPVGRQRVSREKKVKDGEPYWAKYYADKLTDQFEQLGCGQPKVNPAVAEEQYSLF